MYFKLLMPLLFLAVRRDVHENGLRPVDHQDVDYQTRSTKIAE
jgi:hypothetical protein